MTIPEWFVGLFFGALIMGFLSVAALMWTYQKTQKRKREDDRG